jgi:hypothetical protein
MNDIKRFAKTFPPFGQDGQPNWVLVGGGAVMLLTQEDVVAGANVRHGSSLGPSRYHKDLDVCVLRPSEVPGTIRIELNHELYSVTRTTQMRRCRYGEPGEHWKFHVELLSGIGFDYHAPGVEDIALVSCDAGDIPVASPEYVLASKLFGPLPPRSDDKFDADAITRRFVLDPKRLAHHVSTTQSLPAPLRSKAIKMMKQEDWQFLEREVRVYGAKRLSRFGFRVDDGDAFAAVGAILTASELTDLQKVCTSMDSRHFRTQHLLALGLGSHAYLADDVLAHLTLESSESVRAARFGRSLRRLRMAACPWMGEGSAFRLVVDVLDAFTRTEYPLQLRSGIDRLAELLRAAKTSQQQRHAIAWFRKLFQVVKVPE